MMLADRIDQEPIRKEIVKRNRLFCLILTPLLLLFLYLLVFPSSVPRLNQFGVLWQYGDWMLSDYFFTLRSLLDGDPYGNCEIYMPLTYLLLYPFSQLGGYDQLTQEYDRVFLNECWNVPVGMVSYMFLLLLMSLLFWHSLQKVNRYKYLSNWSVCLLFFSSIFIFSIERGNLIILSAACVNYFLAYYRDADRKKVYFALFSLCIASILKIYPAIFGLLLLKEKKYKDILFCFAVGLPLVFLPYLAFKGGFSNIPVHLANIANMQNEFSNIVVDHFGIPKINAMLFDSLIITGPVFHFFDVVLHILNIVLVLLSFALVLFARNPYWKNVMLLACVIILYPINSGFYCGLYFFPVFCIFMGTLGETKLVHYLMIAMMCFIFNPFQIIVLSGVKLTSGGANIVLIIIWLWLIVTSLKDAVMNCKFAKRDECQLEQHTSVC